LTLAQTSASGAYGMGGNLVLSPIATTGNNGSLFSSGNATIKLAPANYSGSIGSSVPNATPSPTAYTSTNSTTVSMTASSGLLSSIIPNSNGPIVTLTATGIQNGRNTYSLTSNAPISLGTLSSKTVNLQMTCN